MTSYSSPLLKYPFSQEIFDQTPKCKGEWQKGESYCLVSAFIKALGLGDLEEVGSWESRRTLIKDAPKELLNSDGEASIFDLLQDAINELELYINMRSIISCWDSRSEHEERLALSWMKEIISRWPKKE